MKTIKITASDTLFFGTGRPFTMGEESWTTGNFPPYPETIYGYLRACYYLDKMGELVNVTVSGKDKSLKLIVDNYGIMLRENTSEQLLFALPADLFIIKEKENPGKLVLKPNDNSVVSSITKTLTHKLVYEGNEKVKDPDDFYFITEADFLNYLAGRIENIKPLRLDSLINIEPKIGNKRDRFDIDKKQLYRINMIRPGQKKSDLVFWTVYDGIDFNTRINRLGGEGKLALIEKMSSFSLPKLNNNFKQGDIVKMYFQTPAIFENDWRPELDDCEVIAAVTGKPLLISGFDIQNKKPKKVQKAVLAGSVFYLKLKNDVTLPSKLGNETQKGYGNVIYTNVL